MGRKPYALKRQGNPNTSMLEATNDPSGGMEKQPESSNPLSENPNLQPEKGNPKLRIQELHPKTQTDSADLSSLPKAKRQYTRRSQRIQNASPSQDKEIERIIEAITLPDEEEDEAPLDHEDEDEDEDEKQPEPIHTQKNMDEKINYLLQQMEALGKTIYELKFKVTRGFSPTESPSEPDVRFKNLYFESQKKVEALMNENHQMALKLERTLGKLEAYESEVMKTMKETILFTNLRRSTGSTVKLSTQAFPLKDAGAGAEASPKMKKSPISK